MFLITFLRFSFQISFFLYNFIKILKLLLGTVSMNGLRCIPLLYLQIESKASGSDTWNFFRICHLNHAPDAEVMMGLFCAAPGEAGMDAIFDYFTLKATEGHPHQGL